MDEHATLVKQINELLDAMRAERGLTSDMALAKEIGVTDVTIYRWRKGLQICKSTKTLLPLAYKRTNQNQQLAAA